MAFSRLQGSSKYQTDASGAATITYTAGLANLTVGSLVVYPVVHYAAPITDLITAVAFNGDAATSRVSKVHATFDVNKVEIWDRQALATGGAHSTAVTLTGSGGTGGGHYLTGSTAEFSYSGSLTVVGTATAEGGSNAPSVTTPAGTQAGDLIVAAFVIANGGDVTITPPGSYTPEWSDGVVSAHEAGASVSRIAAAGGAQAVTWSLSAGVDWSAVVVVYRDSGGGGGGSSWQDLATQPNRSPAAAPTPSGGRSTSPWSLSALAAPALSASGSWATQQPQRSAASPTRSVRSAWELQALAAPTLSAFGSWATQQPQRSAVTPERLRIVSASDTSPPPTLAGYDNDPPAPRTQPHRVTRAAQQLWSLAALVPLAVGTFNLAPGVARAAPLAQPARAVTAGGELAALPLPQPLQSGPAQGREPQRGRAETATPPPPLSPFPAATYVPEAQQAPRPQGAYAARIGRDDFGWLPAFASNSVSTFVPSADAARGRAESPRRVAAEQPLPTLQPFPSQSWVPGANAAAGRTVLGPRPVSTNAGEWPATQQLTISAFTDFAPPPFRREVRTKQPPQTDPAILTALPFVLSAYADFTGAPERSRQAERANRAQESAPPFTATAFVSGWAPTAGLPPQGRAAYATRAQDSNAVDSSPLLTFPSFDFAGKPPTRAAERVLPVTRPPSRDGAAELSALAAQALTSSDWLAVPPVRGGEPARARAIGFDVGTLPATVPPVVTAAFELAPPPQRSRQEPSRKWHWEDPPEWLGAPASAAPVFVPASRPGRIISGGTYNPRRRTV